MPEQMWISLQQEARNLVVKEPLLASHTYSCILNHQCLSSSLSFVLANKLANSVVSAFTFRTLFDQAFGTCTTMIDDVVSDIKAVYDRDPAVQNYLCIMLNFKGFQAIQVHRLAHCIWKQSREDLALFIQSRNSEVFGVDIHPACQIGKGIMFDHATGIVVGETATIEDDVSILQGVTLGGTGNEKGDRHPKIRKGVMIGAGAKVLGNINIGEGAKIGAGSVVLKNVAPHTTVVGIPAKTIGTTKCAYPAIEMDQSFSIHSKPLSLVSSHTP